MARQLETLPGFRTGRSRVRGPILIYAQWLSGGYRAGGVAVQAPVSRFLMAGIPLIYKGFQPFAILQML